MRTITLYYSYSGNTKKIAEMIHEKTGGDIAQIDTVVPYGDDYNQVVAQGQDEVNCGYTPEIKKLEVDLSEYDTVVLGTPVWWYTFAPAIKTFLESNDLSGKTVYPFATNGGWIGHTFKDIENACRGSVVKAGMNIRFTEDRLKTPAADIEKWIQKIQ
ncbi:flavodoxin [Clostridium transplantifaecale]|uniref:flavodoxin n=1 Tax=Clostridium transplantifaecale TaxID=2479838 RepID=UPI000F636410|nr:flavodoxin [Clostridium transplantifaecale]